MQPEGQVQKGKKRIKEKRNRRIEYSGIRRKMHKYENVQDRSVSSAYSVSTALESLLQA